MNRRPKGLLVMGFILMMIGFVMLLISWAPLTYGLAEGLVLFYVGTAFAVTGGILWLVGAVYVK